MPGENFLEDLWKDKAEQEGAEIGDKRGIDLYYSFKYQAGINPELNKLLDNLDESIEKYARSVIRLSKSQESESGKDSLEIYDRHRKILHDSLIDSVNQLSRAYKKLGLDNNWRSDIIGLDREQLGQWALDVARNAMNLEFGE